ncbi:MAG: leucine-rich repeat domain-containing protein, partial [Promethearchaeota archaeon]
IGLEYLVSLKTLNLNSNKLTEIKGLMFLKNLDYLGLGSNELGEIPELERLINLKHVSVSHNPLNQQTISILDKLSEKGIKIYK